MQLAVTVTFDSGEGFAAVGGKLATLAAEFKKLGGVATAVNNAAAITGNGGSPPTAQAEEKPKRGRPKKPVEAAPPPADDDLDIAATPADDDGLGDDLDDGLGDVDGGTAAVPAPPKITAKDILSAFQGYAAAKGKDKAKKILERFGVKSVHDLKPEQYSQALKTVGA